MPRFRTMSDLELLELLENGNYSVDTDKGIVRNRHGKKLKGFRDEWKHWFVVLFADGSKRRGISLAKLVWMAQTRKIIPAGFEVHHYDEDPNNNRWNNLFLLYKDDHQKLHGRSLLASEDAPF